MMIYKASLILFYRFVLKSYRKVIETLLSFFIEDRIEIFLN